MFMKPWLKILIGLALGLAFGLATSREFEVLNILGKVFIDLLKMLVGIIVFSSIVTGICHIHDPKKLGRIGIRTLLFYLLTTVVSISVGLILAYLIKPGEVLSLSCDLTQCGEVRHIGLLAFLSGIIPSNPFASFAEGNVLQIIVFAVFFAYAIILTGEKGKVILSFLESVAAVMYSLTHFVMRFAPIGVFALIATAVGAIGGKVLLPLFKFLLCNYIGFAFQILVVFVLALKFLAKVEVAPYFKGMKDAIVLAFTTSSSSATLPVSLECARDHLGISEDIAGFVMSLGSTVNMNGAAIGQVVAAVFISQAYGIELTWLNIAVLVVTSLLSAIGAAGIPGTGIVMLSMVLHSIGLPIEGIALVAGVDRLREMGSSVVNILGDGVATVFVARRENAINLDQYHHTTWLD